MLTFAVLVLLTGFLLYKSIRLPGVALVGLFCMFAIEQWAQSQSVFFVQRGTVINILFAMIAAFALSVRVYRGGLRNDPYPLGAALVILLLSYALLTTTWTSDNIDIQTLWIKWGPYIVVQVLIAPLLVADPKDLTKIFAFQIFLGGVFAALIIFGSEYQGRKIVLSDDMAIAGNPLAVAEMGGITIFCAVLMKRMFRGDILVKLIISSICLVAIVKSGSRGQLIAVAFALIVAFPFAYSVKNPKIVVGSALVALILGYVVFAGLDTFWADSGRFTSEGMSSDYLKRMDNVQRLLAAWVDSPAAIIFGLGNSASFDPAINRSYPHFVPIEILCEEGVVGAMIYLWILMIVMRDAVFVLRRKETDRSESVGFAILIAIIAYLFLISLKQGNLIGSSTFFMSVMLFVKAVAYTRAQDRQKRLDIKVGIAGQSLSAENDRNTIYARQVQTLYR